MPLLTVQTSVVSLVSHLFLSLKGSTLPTAPLQGSSFKSLIILVFFFNLSNLIHSSLNLIWTFSLKIDFAISSNFFFFNTNKKLQHHLTQLSYTSHIELIFSKIHLPVSYLLGKPVRWAAWLCKRLDGSADWDPAGESHTWCRRVMHGKSLTQPT